MSSETTKDNVPVSAGASISVGIAGYPNVSNCPGKPSSLVVDNYNLIANSAKADPATGNVQMTLECPRLPYGRLAEIVFSGKVTNGRLVGSLQVYFQGNGGVDSIIIPTK